MQARGSGVGPVVPGSGFLERRLARATAVPPAARTPEVAAFVKSAQLVREACELLPLTTAGEPALPNTLATWHKVRWALLALRPQPAACRFLGVCGRFLLPLGWSQIALSRPLHPCPHPLRLSPPYLAGIKHPPAACRCCWPLPRF